MIKYEKGISKFDKEKMLKGINKMLESNLSEKLRKNLEYKKDILINNKTVEK